ncbi:carbohydrate ABC transporter permease [Dactylosporangium sp. NPDC048998]|uniref:carbohydrate ABC transporter permease n=1 Tax=Dactylosporangium sp. NPDC048998 TaxID=3363976 RepID=UPI00371BE39C
MAVSTPPAAVRARRGVPWATPGWWARLRYKLDVKGMPYLYIAPFFLIFFVFGLFPILYTGWMATTRWNRDMPGSDNIFVGLDNFARLIHDDYFWNALRNTAAIGVLGTAPQLLLAMWIAHLMHRRLRARTLLRMGVLVPNVTSVAAVGLIFAQLFGRDFGLINWVLSLVGVHKIDWQEGTWQSWLALAVMITWRWTGYNALIYLAALQAVSDDLYEAADLDGAGELQKFRHITVPALRPTIIFTVIMSTIGTIQLFTEPLMFNPGLSPTGGDSRQFQTLAMYVYEQFWSHGKYAYAATVSWAMFMIIIVAVGVNYLLSRRIRSAT